MKYFPFILVLMSCVSTSQFDALSSPEQAAFERCYDAGHIHVSVFDKPSWWSSARKVAKHQFGAQGSVQRRQLWLLRHGCPGTLFAELYHDR